MYVRFNLSLRDVEDLLAERGGKVSYTTIRRWVACFGPQTAMRLSKTLNTPHPWPAPGWWSKTLTTDSCGINPLPHGDDDGLVALSEAVAGEAGESVVLQIPHFDLTSNPQTHTFVQAFMQKHRS
tara:strand:- start:57 stop:431 length:375 start_codon:yes stop_codon:yes gene_type:complete